jgi:RNase P subunit RPR2
MELYEPLPLSLRSCYKEGILPATRQQLEFLWRAAHAITSSTSLTHCLARKFIDLGNKFGLHFPEQVKNRLCSYCSAVLLPSITSMVRVQSRGKESKIHRKKHLIPRGDSNGDPDVSVVVDGKTRRKLKNQVVRFNIYLLSTMLSLNLIPAIFY